MPKWAVRILVSGIAVSSALVGAAQAEQQKPQNTNATSQAAAASSKTIHPKATAAKFIPANRDVCDKHPNLKQCS